MSKAIILFALGLLAAAYDAEAQTRVNINRAVLTWDWAPDADGAQPTEFRVYCGQSSKSYTKVTAVQPATVRQVPIKQITDGLGQWYCAITAANADGESGASAEVPFVGVAVPSTPSNPRVQAQ